MNHKQRIAQQNAQMPAPMLAVLSPTPATPEPEQTATNQPIAPGTAVTMTMRAEKGHTGIVLAANSIEAWTGTQAFNYGTPTQEQVDAQMKLLAEMDERQSLRGYEPFAPSVPVRWSFGRVYWERVADLLIIE